MGKVLEKIHAWELDIDIFINRFIPNPPWHRLPWLVAHFLGHRPHPPRKIGNVLIMFWSVVGIFGGLLVVTAVSTHIPSFQEREVPMVIGSFGAAAVLEYCAIESPLAQPRNAVLGHLFGAIVGRSVAALFELSPRRDQLWWIAGPLGCALATLFMVLTKTIHPPAGSTALLAIVDPSIRGLGWFLLPVVLLSSVLIVATALVLNNIHRRFPLHWWTSEALPHKKTGQSKQFESSPSSSEVGDIYQLSQDLERGCGVLPKVNHITIKHEQVLVPDGVVLTPDELQFLERLSRRI
ncbi:hypothetical protein VTO42DRAFT_7492 [Malbranchea cinnamomea]